MFPPIPNPSVASRPRRNFGEQDLIRRSASTVTPPAERQSPRSRSSSTSRSASAARPARRPASSGTTCIEEVGVNLGVYDNPARPDAGHVHADALHRVGEPGDRQSRMADPQGRLHALRGSGLPQGLPGARRHRAVLERHRRFRPRELHRLRLLHEGMPVQHPAHLARSTTRPTNARSAPTASRSGRGRPAPRPARPRRSCSAPRRR